MVPNVEQAFHQLVSSRIDLTQISHEGKAVGQIAASAARDAHLRQGFGVGFKNSDLCFGAQFFQSLRTETACRAGTDDGNVLHAGMD